LISFSCQENMLPNIFPLKIAQVNADQNYRELPKTHQRVISMRDSIGIKHNQKTTDISNENKHSNTCLSMLQQTQSTDGNFYPNDKFFVKKNITDNFNFSPVRFEMNDIQNSQQDSKDQKFCRALSDQTSRHSNVNFDPIFSYSHTTNKNSQNNNNISNQSKIKTFNTDDKFMQFNPNPMKLRFNFDQNDNLNKHFVVHANDIPEEHEVHEVHEIHEVLEEHEIPEEHVPTLANRDTFFAWTVNCHNYINALLGLRQVSVDEARESISKRYFDTTKWAEKLKYEQVEKLAVAETIKTKLQMNEMQKKNQEATNSYQTATIILGVISSVLLIVVITLSVLIEQTTDGLFTKNEKKIYVS